MRPGLLDAVLLATSEHVQLVAISLVIALAVGIPSGVMLARRPLAQKLALGLASVGQTIPSLALFGFLIPIRYIGGLGDRPAIFALVLYALLPILRNTVAGLASVDPAVRESALAMGMTPGQSLWRIEFPLASRTILAGVRIATVATIGTATIAAAIGAGGLGQLIFRGLASVDKVQILAGAIPAALIALLCDGGLGWIEKRLSAQLS